MNLPTISKSLVCSVRRDMNTQGFALVDTSRFFVGKEWPTQRSQDFKILNSNFYGCYMHLEECSTNWIKCFIKWQERLLNKALSNEKLQCRSQGLSLRNERTKNDTSCNWHLDGSYIRSLCVIKGQTTEIKTDLGASYIPLGWTLFITAQDRKQIPATWHRRPRTKSLRRLIVYGWDCA